MRSPVPKMGEINMIAEHQMEVLRRLSDIADSAGVVNQIDRKHGRIVMAYTLEPGRTHIVYVEPAKVALSEEPAVSVSSPCTIFENGSRTPTTKDEVPGPVFVSGCELSANYEVLESNEHSIVVANLVHNLDSLNEDELVKSLACVANAAERYEERFGPHDH
jgi:hypothetical protein